MTPQEQLVAELDDAARRVDAAIAGLDDEKASRPAADGWSVKDHLTHLTFWHEMRFFEMSRIARGGRAGFLESNTDRLNEQIAGNRRGLPLEQVIADLNFARDMVRQAVLSAPEARLDLSLFAEIGPAGAAHDDEHAGLIETWRAREGI
jgi:hypothetical protein